MLDDSVSSYYNSAWDEGLSRRGASATWHKYVEYVEKNQLEVITVKAWDLKNRGMLTATKEGISEESAWESYEFDLLVHKGVASAVKAAFDEIYALPINERLPIKKSISSKTEKGFTYNFNGACFAFGARGNGSIHCIGVAIDINPDANPMKSSSTNKGYGNMKNYKPGVNPYSISSTSKVVEILGKYGFEWGDGYSDYMHVSYLENVNDNIEDYSSLVK